MDALLLIKCLLLGILWGGSFLWIASVGLHIFPLPALFRLREWCLSFVARKYKKNLALGDRYGSFSMRVFKLSTFLMWLAVLAGYAYGLHALLLAYFPNLSGQALYWLYWLLSALPAGGLIVVWGIRFLFMGKRTAMLPEPPAQPENLTLLEQLKG